MWLWPYTEPVRAARAEVDRLCADGTLHAEIRTQEDEFTSTMVRVRALIAAIEKVRDTRKVPEIVVETEPAPLEAPVPPKKT